MQTYNVTVGYSFFLFFLHKLQQEVTHIIKSWLKLDVVVFFLIG